MVRGALSGTEREDWRMVFMVLAGCIMVWAAERLMAPQIMASQKWRRRSGAGEGLEGDLAAPPLPTREVVVVDDDDDVVVG